MFVFFSDKNKDIILHYFQLFYVYSDKNKDIILHYFQFLCIFIIPERQQLKKPLGEKIKNFATLLNFLGKSLEMFKQFSALCLN